jgi:hypothetical protein
MRWTGRVARMGERMVAHGVLLGEREGKRPFEDVGLDRMMILKRSSRSGMGRHGLDWSGSG